MKIKCSYYNIKAYRKALVDYGLFNEDLFLDRKSIKIN
jgi:hypothetical protein